MSYLVCYFVDSEPPALVGQHLQDVPRSYTEGKISKQHFPLHETWSYKKKAEIWFDVVQQQKMVK